MIPNRLLSLLFAVVFLCASAHAQTGMWPSETLRSGIVGAWTRTADFDQDGDPDILVQAGDSVYWYENLRPGWAPHLIDPTFINSVYGYVDVVDMDKDGDMDVLKANGQGDGKDELSWNENQSKGANWVKHHIATATYSISWIQNAVGDLDGDGDKDIAVAETDFTSKGSLYWLEQTADPDVWIKHPLATGLHWFASVGDMDGDKDLDIVSSAAGVFWLENQLPSTTWTKHTVVSGKSSEYFIGTCADMNGDSMVDIVAGPSDAHGAISFFANPLWGEVTMHPDAVFYYIGPAGDVDGDGDADFLYGGPGSSALPLGWTENQNAGLNWSPHNITPDTYLQQIPTGLADIDGDGDTDIVSLTFDGNTGLGSALWFANPKISTGTSGLVKPAFPLVISPNPATDYIDILPESAQPADLQIQLIDMTGRVLQSREAFAGAGAIRLSLQGVAPGTYLVKVCSEAGFGIQKVVRQ